MKAPRPSSVTFVLLLSLAGCYHYVPPRGPTIPQGTPVRVRLSQPRDFELSALTAHNIDAVTGEMIRDEPDELVLSALWLDAATGQGFDAGGWTFRLSRASVTELRVRSLSRWRSALVVVGGFVATWLGFDALRGSDVGSGSGNQGGEPR